LVLTAVGSPDPSAVTLQIENRQTMTPSTNDQRPDFMERPPFKHPHIRYRSKTNLLAQAAQSCKCTNTDIAKTTGQVTDFVEESIQEERSACPSLMLAGSVLAPCCSFDARRKGPPSRQRTTKGVPKGRTTGWGAWIIQICAARYPSKPLNPGGISPILSSAQINL
jgi:hypothetical protein